MIENHLRNSLDVYDGDESGFIQSEVACECPVCDGQYILRLAYGESLRKIEGVSVEDLVKSIGRVTKKSVAGKLFFKWGGLPLQFQRSKCEGCDASILTVFVAGEFQPGRYMATILGTYHI